MNRHAIVIALSLLAASAASSQQPTEAPATPDRLVNNPYDPDFNACTGLMEEPKHPSQLACYTTGTISRFGEISGSTAKCDNAVQNERVAQCMRGQMLKSQYLGYEGPFCAAVLFDVRAAPNGSLRNNDLQRTTRVKEVYPCAGRPAPPKADTDLDFIPGVSKPVPPKFILAGHSACRDGANAADGKAICFARAGVDASGRAAVGPAAVCTDPKMTDKAIACLADHELNPKAEADPPKSVCLYIQYFSKKLFEKGKGPSFSSVALSACPPGFF